MVDVEISEEEKEKSSYFEQSDEEKPPMRGDVIMSINPSIQDSVRWKVKGYPRFTMMD